MSTKKASEDVRGYRKLLLEASELRAQGGRSAYQRTKLLVQVFKDRDFRAEAGNVDDFRAAEVLDEYVEDLALSFLELRAMYEHFPKESSGAKGSCVACTRRSWRRAGNPNARYDRGTRSASLSTKPWKKNSDKSRLA